VILRPSGHVHEFLDHGIFGGQCASSPIEGGAMTTRASAEEPADVWTPVARSDEVGTSPVRVDVDGVPAVAFRAESDGPASVVGERCPHRLVSMAHATRVDGTLRCPYHGWRFAPDGRCVEIPSAGPDAAIPPRARLETPWQVREDGGWVWAAPADDVRPGPDARATQETLTNIDDALASGWHPLVLIDEVPVDGACVARLLGRTWTVRRGPDGAPSVNPAPHAVAQRFGLLWIAPREPAGPLLDCPDEDDPDYVGAWLPPERSASAAGVLAENFLDVAHFPFVHAGTFGAAEEHYVPPFDVQVGDGELASVQEQWFDNPEDPGVAAGVRPVRQRRRATYAYRVPFQLLLRLEELDAGAVKTILFFLQPEDAGSTRIYTKMLFHGIGGVARPSPEVVAAEVDFERAVLGEDLTLQRAMTVSGLPLRMRDELHVRSDRSGVALRRLLRRFVGLDDSPP
jgi:phenylpropionate dioxygenase-like ring-hydroxylating dioxygenase large terminal subunit